MPKINGLTPKQRGFIKDYLETGNASEAVRRNYNATTSVRTIGHENITKPYIAAVIAKEIEEQEMDRKYVMKRLKDHASQDEERMASLKALELTARIIRLIDNDNANHSDRENLPGNNEVRAREAARSIETLAQCLAESGGRFALFVESGDPGIYGASGETAHGSSEVHRDVE